MYSGNLDEIDKALMEISAEEKKIKKKKNKKTKGKVNNNQEIVNIDEFTESYISDPNIKNILQDTEKEKRDYIKKKLRAKINVLEQNRIPETEENIKYDKKGKKIGRIQKEYIMIPKGQKKDPYDIDTIKQIASAVKNDPKMKQQFLDKSGIPEDIYKDVDESSRFELIEEII